MELIVGILVVIIGLQFAERWWDKERSLKMQDMLNRALIAKSVPEYEATASSEIEKLRAENDLAIHAENILKDTKREEEGIPIT